MAAIDNTMMQEQIATAIGQAIEHHRAGRLAEAESIYRQVLAIAPAQPDALHLLGLIARQTGHLDHAIDLIRQSLVSAPDHAPAHSNLGNALRDKRQTDEAVACYRRAIALNPGYAEAHYNLSVALIDQHRLQEALSSARQALVLRPDFAEAHHSIASALAGLGHADDAAFNYRRAIALRPEYVEAHNNLGNVLQSLGLFDEAEASYRAALSIRPDYAESFNNLGSTLNEQGRLGEALASFRRAIELKPDYAEAHGNLGNLLQTLGDPVEAIACCRRAIMLRPDDAEAHSNLIFALDMDAAASAAQLQAERRRWNERHATGTGTVPRTPAAPAAIHAGNTDPQRRLRIGYVSADFRNHSAARVFGALLIDFDRDSFDVYAYANSHQEDERTRQFRDSVTGWRTIAGLPDDEVAELIRRDGIDILVDLSGHSRGNRLKVFARRPAPIQVTGWGYIGGTGLTAMDVFMADAIVAPEDERALFSERICHLPSVVSAFYPEGFPDIGDLPAQAPGKVTFGSFNRLCKISPEAYRTWAQVLQALPESRLLLKTHELDDETARARVLETFVHAGVQAERIALLGRTGWREHMEAWRQIDLALDPYPHGGGVTTLEGLMMGIPVVTLRWPTVPGRLSASILTTLGLTDWIAESPDRYIAIATEKARNLDVLGTLRHALRSRCNASIIGDTIAYARAVESQYRRLWCEWKMLSA